MPGVRIQHPTERNGLFVLMDQSRKYPEPLFCIPCGGVPHVFKTYHFRLDDSGAAVVSVEIVERLKRIPGHGFVVANEVKAPPAQHLVIPLPQSILISASPTQAHKGEV